MSEPWRDLLVRHFPTLTGRSANDEGWISVNCPLHPDTTQSAGVNTLSGRFICHSPDCQTFYLQSLHRPESGAKSLGMAELFHFIHGWTTAEATTVIEDYRVDRLDTDFKHDDDTHSGQNGETIIHFFSHEVEEFVREANIRLRDHFDNIDLAVDYSASRSISPSTMGELGVGYVPGKTDLPDGTTSGVHGCLLLPYWFRERLVGVRIRQADSRKRMLRSSHYVPYNLNSIFDTTARTVVIGEGESDVLRLAQALKQAHSNIPVVGTPGVKFDPKWSRFLRRFNRIIAVPQADLASQKDFIGNLQRTFQDRLEVVQIPWEEDALGGKDVCDFLLMRPDQERSFVELLGLSEQDSEERPYLKTYEYFQERADRPVDWLIPGVVERGSKVLVVGDPKVGKTFVALNLIESLLTGEAFMGRDEWTPTRTNLRCLLVEEEGSERALTRRILTIVSPTDQIAVVHGEGVKLDDPTSFARLRQEVMKFRPDLIVLDPYASLHTQDENTVEGTMKVMQAVNTLYRALPGSTIVILHHRAKLGGGARGSGALWGAIDYQIMLFRQDNQKRTIGVEITGREVEDDPAPLYFEFNPGTMKFEHKTDTIITLIKKSQQQPNDPHDRAEVIRVLQEEQRPLTTNEVANSTKKDYMTVRAILLELDADGLVTRTGNGGRGGYQYAWKDD